jgi:hypothetical protein
LEPLFQKVAAVHQRVGWLALALQRDFGVDETQYLQISAFSSTRGEYQVVGA